MPNTNDKSNVTESDSEPTGRATTRELSQQQAMKNAEAARDTHRSHTPGVDDDSEAIQGWAAALAAPIEGAADALRENERTKADDVNPPRPTDEPNVTNQSERRAQPPTRTEDAEWDPLKATAEHRSGSKQK
ncbi:MAG TPA: hypothetical protein VNA21_09785 [Steroidobacteraceae bacterium]|nr:hypothetical protein [Steroidobacteraceae bacterium]